MRNENFRHLLIKPFGLRTRTPSSEKQKGLSKDTEWASSRAKKSPSLTRPMLFPWHPRPRPSPWELLAGFLASSSPSGCKRCSPEVGWGWGRPPTEGQPTLGHRSLGQPALGSPGLPWEWEALHPLTLRISGYQTSDCYFGGKAKAPWQGCADHSPWARTVQPYPHEVFHWVGKMAWKSGHYNAACATGGQGHGSTQQGKGPALAEGALEGPLGARDV